MISDRLFQRFNSIFLSKLETPIVAFLLLFAEALNVPFIPPVIINSFSYATVLFLIAIRLRRFAYFLLKDISFVSLIILAVLSVYWSINPSETLQEVRALVRSMFFSIYLALQYNPTEQIKLLSWVTGLAILLSFIVCLLFPSYGIASDPDNYSAWTGIFTHKQIFGRFLSFSASIFLVRAAYQRNQHWLNFVLLSLILILTIFSQSKTSLMGFFILVTFLPFYRIARQKGTRFLLMLITLLIAICLAIILTLNLQTIVVDMLGKNLEFNGRTPIWTMIIEKGLRERPLLGYGYNAFWTSDVSTPILMNSWARGQENFVSGEDIFHAHNGFIDLFIQLGIVGVVIFIVNFLETIRKTVYLLFVTRRVEYFWMLEFLLIYLIFNFIEGQTLLSTNNILWLSYGYVSVSSSVHYGHLKNLFNHGKNREHSRYLVTNE